MIKITRQWLVRLLAAAACISTSTALAETPPRLVLQITVDQLRGDLPARHMQQFGKGGLRYLWESGVVYRNAHHMHANTETIVGHTTLATGAQPAVHGMVGNLWFDRDTGFTTYNVEDARYPLLTAGADVDEASEIDPTQRAARSDGRSPLAILVSTFSDELRAATAGKAKAIGVSVKDRGAISMAGHAGTAYWFSKASGEFVSSRYYLPAYPEWVQQWNAEQKPRRYANTKWSLLRNKDEYLFGQSDDREWEADVAGFGRTFPHDYGDGSSRYFTTWLTLSPAGDELVVDFAKQAVVEEQLGADSVTDFLSVSLSSTDYVGHVFGPSSLEAEDNLLRLDRTLADLLQFIDRKVGLEHTLIVLAADHGAPEAPGYLNELGIPASYVDPDTWDAAGAMDRIKQRFAIDGPLIEAYDHPYVYLAPEVKSRSDIDQAALEAAVTAELSTFDGVSLAVSSSALRAGAVPDTPMHRAVLNNFYPDRAGDVFIVFDANNFINDFDGLVVASTHGSPWSYDTFVPVIFAGMKMQPQHIYRKVHTVDVATTLSAYLGIKSPSGASGAPLPEVLKARGR